MKGQEGVGERLTFVPATPDLEQLVDGSLRVWIVGPGEAPPALPGVQVSATHLEKYRLAWIFGGSSDGKGSG